MLRITRWWRQLSQSPAGGGIAAERTFLRRRLDGQRNIRAMRGPRPRRPVRPATLSLVWPLFRYSPMRDAYVLRGIGGRLGPVLVPQESRDGPHPV
ncbi:MAG: hypothetical protein QOG41_1842 [Thermoleophilaceae bacterium]|nr:hypothetical protein [Thermoleophilaceae bacterium]